MKTREERAEQIAKTLRNAGYRVFIRAEVPWTVVDIERELPFTGIHGHGTVKILDNGATVASLFYPTDAILAAIA